MDEKQRADVLLHKRGFCESRQKAQALIMAGSVYVDEVKIIKASEMLEENANIILREKEHNFVSRGALKLEKAIHKFNASVKNKVCIDIGAATGGFTDVLLQNGAEYVYAVDVGYGQFDWGLRSNPKVKLYERTNARFLEAALFNPIPEIMVMDVSFISIKLILPRIIELLGKNSIFYVLIKPQFEVGKGKVGKNGVVKNKTDHFEVIVSIQDFLSTYGWGITQLDYSPIKGPKGNIEYICEMRFFEKISDLIETKQIMDIVDLAHSKL